MAQRNRSVGQEVEILPQRVGFVPANGSRAADPGVEDHFVEPAGARGDAPFGAQRERVPGRVGDAVAAEVGAPVVVAYEAGVGVAVGGVEHHVAVGQDLERQLAAERTRAPGVGHHAARGAARGKDGELLVAAENPEKGEIAPQDALGAGEVAAQLEIPAFFGTVGHEPGVGVVDARSHLSLELFLQDVGEKLGVESACLVAFGDGEVEVARFVEAV